MYVQLVSSVQAVYQIPFSDFSFFVQKIKDQYFLSFCYGKVRYLSFFLKNLKFEKTFALPKIKYFSRLRFRYVSCKRIIKEDNKTSQNQAVLY